MELGAGCCSAAGSRGQEPLSKLDHSRSHPSPPVEPLPSGHISDRRRAPGWASTERHIVSA
eukprot:7199581-Alexandrium_andersonii.AAC.1